MLWTNKHTRIRHLAVLALLLIAFAGPWVYDSIMVPAEYPCTPPFVRLHGDFCGLPLSGIWFPSTAAQLLVIGVEGLVTGTIGLADLGRDFLLIPWVLLLLLPVASTLLSIWSGDRQRRPVLHLGMWGPAAVAIGLGLRTISGSAMLSRLWGLWLYTGLVLIVLIGQVVTLCRLQRFRR
jgi:hypothetical protein